MKAAQLRRVDATDPAALEAQSLPAWIYHDAEFFEREKEAVLRNSWQPVCHLSDIPRRGDFHTLEFLGESAVVIRAEDGAVRAFHNVCRHRAARLLDGPQGHCAGRITCPYHAWSYALDGRLVGVPNREGFKGLDTASHGLAPLEHEVFMGFVFVRFAPGLPSVKEMAAPYARELEPYRLEELVPLGRVQLRPRAVNWKNVADNYSDGLHINVAHPGLTRLFGRGYGIEAHPWIDKMSGTLRDTPSRNWSERHYQQLLPPVAHLPPERQRLWTYFKLWPNFAFDVYPDQIDFMQFLPLSPTETLIREIAYAHPDTRREMRAARYLNWRINRRVGLEDKALIERVQAGMASSSYSCGPLSEGEVCLRSFARRMRQLIPECTLAHSPPRGWSHGWRR
ncbi:MAG TPA: aromatic ring-hydroxylating dioxygenase subunit alpha [Steroidobacteraceae bacterium]|jgi:phenylpropionate dioxygenase-like ring-hydroxylating dioxygenase large terminal subunit|nr:aromatic ring-hydroxylating dioxygenase subunit alpha [Steroidobacteraceae bacterium]